MRGPGEIISPGRVRDRVPHKKNEEGRPAVLVYDVPEAEDIAVFVVTALNEVVVFFTRASITPFFEGSHTRLPSCCWQDSHSEKME